MTMQDRTFCPCCGWDVKIDEDALCMTCGATAHGEALEALIAEIERIKKETYCAYCSEAFPLDAPDAAERISAHIACCPRHPMRGVERDLAEARGLLACRTEQRDSAERRCLEAKRALDDAARPAIQAFGKRVLQLIRVRMTQFEMAGEYSKAAVLRDLLDTLSGVVVP
jgi:hypothetical protein